MPSEEEYEAIIETVEEFHDTGKTEQAKALCQETIQRAELAGEDAFAHCFRGRMLALAYDYAGFLSECEIAVGLSPNSYLINAEMGDALRWVDRSDRSVQFYGKALELRADYVRALSERARALAVLGRTQEALRDAERAMALGQDDYGAILGMAEVLRNRDSARAEALYRSAVEARPDGVAALVGLAVALAEKRRPHEAEAELQKAMGIRADDPELASIRGYILYCTLRGEEALPIYEGVLAKWPKDRNARFISALILDDLGRKDEAIERIRELAQDCPWDVEVKRWLFRLEGPERAKELAKEQDREQLRQQREAWEREIRLDAWRKLSGRTAHRIDNQVFAAMGALRDLKAKGDPALAEAVLDLGESLDRIGAICSEFRRFSTNRAPRFKPTDLPILIHDTVRRYKKSAEGIDVDVELPSLLPECVCDPDQMEQALGELLENAIRHTAKGQRIVVSAEPCELAGAQGVRIAVVNYGTGIDQKHRARLFDAFFSLRPGGTGLGLAIVRQNVENHHGTIRETGEPGKFARFEIELPALQDKEDSR